MTSAEKAFCEGWVKAHARTWQVLNRSEWKYQFHPKTLVRYVEEVRQTEQEIQLLLEYLASADCVATLSLYDQSVSATWKPTRAWLELGNKSVQGVRSVRLYHGLMTDADQAADGPYVIEDGCAYAVSITYYWNKNDTPSVPSGTSGVSYQISGLQRDAETGLYTYAIERRERVQQDIPEYLTATTLFEDSKEEAHFGVKQAFVETTGKQASAGDGKIVQRKVSKNADCTSDIHNTTTEERPVSDATVSKRMTLSGLVVRKESKNQPSPLSDPTEVGDAVSNTKTPGGLYDTMQEQAGRVGAGKIRESHSETAFNRFDHEVENVSASEATGIDVDSATLQADGTIERKSKHKNENGTSDVVTETVRPVERSREFSWSDSYRTYTKFRYWNFKEPQKPSFSGSDTKVSCEFGMNAHGLYDGSWEMAYNGGGGESIHQWSSTWDEQYVINVLEVDGRKKFFGQKYRVTKRIKRNSNESGIDVAISDIQEAEGSWSSFCGTKPAKYESRMLNWSRCIWVVYDFQDISGGLTSWMED